MAKPNPRCVRCNKSMRNDGTAEAPQWVCNNPKCVRYVPPKNKDNGGKGEITWTTADNQRVPLGVSDFAAINGAAATRSNALHIKYNELKDQVNACTTIDEVEAITWEG